MSPTVVEVMRKDFSKMAQSMLRLQYSPNSDRFLAQAIEITAGIMLVCCSRFDIRIFIVGRS